MFHGADRESKAVGNLLVAEPLVTAHEEDFAPALRHLLQRQLVEQLYLLGIELMLGISLQVVWLLRLLLLIGHDDVAMLKHVENLVAHHGVEVGTPCLLQIENLRLAPQLDKHVLRHILGIGFRFEDGARKAFTLGKYSMKNFSNCLCLSFSSIVFHCITCPQGAKLVNFSEELRFSLIFYLFFGVGIPFS